MRSLPGAARRAGALQVRVPGADPELPVRGPQRDRVRLSRRGRPAAVPGLRLLHRARRVHVRVQGALGVQLAAGGTAVATEVPQWSPPQNGGVRREPVGVCAQLAPWLQWSPPQNGGVRLHVHSEYSLLDGPQWSPPQNGGVRSARHLHLDQRRRRRRNGAAERRSQLCRSSHRLETSHDAAMESAAERRSQPGVDLPVVRAAPVAAMESAAERRSQWA
jgi:hypothetical protein